MVLIASPPYRHQAYRATAQGLGQVHAPHAAAETPPLAIPLPANQQPPIIAVTAYAATAIQDGTPTTLHYPSPIEAQPIAPQVFDWGNAAMTGVTSVPPPPPLPSSPAVQYAPSSTGSAPLLAGGDTLSHWVDAAEGLSEDLRATVYIHGTRISFYVGTPAHKELIRGHIRREWHGYVRPPRPSPPPFAVFPR
jgi:hypothetical protein